MPAAVFMVVFAPRSAKLVEARGARLTLLTGYALCLLGFAWMLVFWNDGISYWEVAVAYSFVGAGVGFAGTPASHSLTGSVPVARAGMASGTADLQRDLGGAVMQSILGALLTAGYAAAVSDAIASAPASAQKLNHGWHPVAAHEVVRQRGDGRAAAPRSTPTRSRPPPSSHSSTALTGRTPRGSSRSCSARRRLLHVPEEGGREDCSRGTTPRTRRPTDRRSSTNLTSNTGMDSSAAMRSRKSRTSRSVLSSPRGCGGGFRGRARRVSARWRRAPGRPSAGSERNPAGADRS